MHILIKSIHCNEDDDDDNNNNKKQSHNDKKWLQVKMCVCFFQLKIKRKTKIATIGKQKYQQKQRQAEKKVTEINTRSHDKRKPLNCNLLWKWCTN